MKVIKYKVKATDELLLDASIFCKDDATLEANIPIAKRDAYNGEYIVEDDGRPSPDTACTDDVLNALLGVTE